MATLIGCIGPGKVLTCIEIVRQSTVSSSNSPGLGELATIWEPTEGVEEDMTTARMGDKGSPPRVSSRTHGFSPTNIFMDVPTKVK